MVFSDKACLIGTAKDAIAGKGSVIHGGYKLDPNAQCTYTSRYPGKSQVPLLNRVYFSRMRAIHHLYMSYRDACRMLGEGPVQILVLGAGFDTAFNSGSAPVFLVDYPEVIQERMSRNIDVGASSVTLVGGDLCQPEALFAALLDHGLKVHSPTLVLLESVLAYLPPPSARTLLQMLATRLTHAAGVLYDPVLPTERACPLHRCSNALRETFAARHVPLLSVQPSCLSLCKFLRDCGMQHVMALSVQEAMHVLAGCGGGGVAAEGSGERAASTGIVDDTYPDKSRTIVKGKGFEAPEVFDEFAALASLQQMYAVSWFGSGCGAVLFDCWTKNFFGKSACHIEDSSTRRPADKASSNGDGIACLLPGGRARLQALERRLRSLEMRTSPPEMTDTHSR